ncbi:MAG TPA: alpha/beta fold hydrolase [Methylomirabilota bacterium]|jgi:alpha-beta hydrolase superfamily lysophospholipase|nr:alpha/beta fold hydrolase [Methylomirabilota bacterium]
MPRITGVPVLLVSARTRDGVVLDGVAAHPRGRRRTALVWVHGLGSSFSSGQPMIRTLVARLNAAGLGYLKLDTRGHGVVARAGARLVGAAFERFGASVHDLRAAIGLAAASGYRRVILAGHSTGANKALHYLARTGDRRVAGLALLGPIADVAGEWRRIGRRALARRVAAAERIARHDPEALVPRAWGFLSARRYISLYRPGEAEDVFPYYRAGARWPALRRVRVPVAVIIGGGDEYLDRRAAEVVAAFERSAIRAQGFTGIVVPRARHGFRGHEPAVARALVRWARTVG